MQLKNVVLPAPFGPMTLTMAPSSSVKSSALTASSPPHRLVAPVASRSAMDDGAEDDARDAAHAAHDDDGCHVDGHEQVDAAREHSPDEPGEDGSSEPGEGGSQHVGQRLGLHEVDAEGLG